MDLIHKIESLRYDIENGVETDVIKISVRLIQIRDHALQLQQTGVSGSTLLPDGWKVYKCTDCHEINVKKDNRQITVGFCDNCEHPLWNDDVD